MNYWEVLKLNFNDIITNYKDKTYFDIKQKIIKINFNYLLYGIIGFPIDLLIDEIIKEKFNITTPEIHKKECIFNKNMVYFENQHFIEIDLLNPNMTKDLKLVTNMILYIINTKNIISDKHFIIIKHIDKLDDFYTFRIILEKFQKNAYFLCTTHKICKIENPIKSRFNLCRIPLMKTEMINYIYDNYLKIKLNNYLINNRNIVFCIFISQIEKNEPLLITESFCNYNFPPLQELINNKKIDISDIRLMSNKCCQYNISINNLVIDLLKNKKIKDKKKIIKIGSEIDHLLSISNKGREPIYIENLLCQVLL